MARNARTSLGQSRSLARVRWDTITSLLRVVWLILSAKSRGVPAKFRQLPPCFGALLLAGLPLFLLELPPFSPNRTPICEWLRLLPKALRPLPMVCVLFPGIPKGYAAPRPYRGPGAALRCMSAPHVGVRSTFYFCMHYSKLSFLLKMRFCLVYSTSCRPGSAFINRGGVGGSHPRTRRFGVVCIA